MELRLRIIDLDSSITDQEQLVTRYQPQIFSGQHWGPRIRMACAFGRFRRFMRALADDFGTERDLEPMLTFCGSGDFHHVSLALLARQESPFNLVVIDNHPDWMRGVPFLHCGTWLYHAARLPQLNRIIHIGGDVDFDNYYRWMAPWPWLRSEKIIVLPALRQFQRGQWRNVPHTALRRRPAEPVTPERLDEALQPLGQVLGSLPLYVSLDKDVMTAAEAVVNWDSGHLTLPEVRIVLQSLLRAAGGQLAAMDVVGDWSPVTLRGWLRRWFHATEHPALMVHPDEARRRNEQMNQVLIDDVCRWTSHAARRQAV
jgi:hypothetical protein